MEPDNTHDRKSGAASIDDHIQKILRKKFKKDRFGKEFTVVFPLTEEQLPDIVTCLRNQMKLEKSCHKELLKQATAHFIRQSNIQKICLRKNERIFIVGDLHGQFYDMLQIFKQSGFPSRTNKYLFNGDLVDRGNWSCEIIILLLCAMLARRSSVYINRGNHECHTMSSAYGFQKELGFKYSLSLVEYYLKVFYTLPLGTLLSLPRHQVKASNIYSILNDRRMSFVYDKDNNPIDASDLHRKISKSVNLSSRNEVNDFINTRDGERPGRLRGVSCGVVGVTNEEDDARGLNSLSSSLTSSSSDSEDEFAQQIIKVNTEGLESEIASVNDRVTQRSPIPSPSIPLPPSTTSANLVAASTNTNTNSKNRMDPQKNNVVSLDDEREVGSTIATRNNKSNACSIPPLSSTLNTTTNNTPGSATGYNDPIKIGPRVIIFHGGIPVPVSTNVKRTVKTKDGGTLKTLKRIQQPVTISHINSLKRFIEPDEGTDSVINQILWADPMDKKGVQPSERSFSSNFGPDITQGFLDENHLSYVIRSHEVVDGHVVHRSHNSRLITLFSAPDAFEEGSNSGEYVQFDGSKIILFPDRWNYIKIQPCKKPAPVWSGDAKACSIM